MRTNSSISLDIGGDHFHIRCEDSEALALIAGFSQRWQAAPAVLPGYQVSAPSKSKRLWVLLGSNGAVLARSLRRDDVLTCLERHLHALASPRAADASRFSLTAVAGPEGVVLVHPDLFRYQPFIERRWAQAGLSIVDSPFAQIRLESDPVAVASPSSDSTATYPGHCALADAAGPVRGLLWTGYHDAPAATHAQVVHALATSLLAGDRDDRLEAAKEWARHLGVLLVPAFERKSLLTSATELLNSSRHR